MMMSLRDDDDDDRFFFCVCSCVVFAGMRGALFSSSLVRAKERCERERERMENARLFFSHDCTDVCTAHFNQSSRSN